MSDHDSQSANRVGASPMRANQASPGLRLRQAHATAQPLISPLAHDALSARLIERAGFKAFNIGGSSLLAANYALPDLGLAGLGEMVAAMQNVVGAVNLPALVDADDGYGDTKSVIRTVRALERLGVGGLLLEDQDRLVKQPRQMLPATYQHSMNSARNCRSTRCSGTSDLVIIARTDALGALGLDEALREPSTA